MGAATALLFGLAGMIPAPEEPVLPFNLQTASQSSKVSKDEKEIEDFKVEDFIGPYDIGNYIFLFYLELLNSRLLKRSTNRIFGRILA